MGGVGTESSSLVSIKQVPADMKMSPVLSPVLAQPTFEMNVQGFVAPAQVVDLRAKSVSLRQLTPADYPEYKEILDRNLDTLRGIGLNSQSLEALDSPETFELMWQLSERSRLLGTDFSFGIFSGDKLIGKIALEAVRRGPYESAFLSAWLDKDSQGQENIETAFVLLCKFGFEDLGLNRIECAVLPDNEAVQKALKKVGVESEGTAREYLLVDGESRDHLRYVITATDWKERGAQLLSEWAGT